MVVDPIAARASGLCLLVSHRLCPQGTIAWPSRFYQLLPGRHDSMDPDQ